MKKDEFVVCVAEKLEKHKKEIGEVLDCICEMLVDVLKKGDEVVLPIGKFVVKTRAAREGVNPATGAKVKIPAKVVPAFKPNKKMKDAIGA